MLSRNDKLKFFVQGIVANLCDRPDGVTVDIASMATNTPHADVRCYDTDMKYVLGIDGVTINSVRTLFHSVCAKEGLVCSLRVNAR